MYVLCLVAILSATGPPPDQTPTASVVTVVAPAKAPSTAGSAVVHRTLLRHAMMAAPAPSGWTMPELIPHQAALNRLYNEHRADGRWRGGYAITFALADSRRTLTLNLGWFKLTFPGHPPARP